MSLLQNFRDNSGQNDEAWRSCVRRWAIVSLLLILLASWFSYGFYHLDEQYQVIEFVSYKLGKTPASELAWEHGEKIRPWLQPAIYYLAGRGLLAVGIDNPYLLSFSFRLISGLCGWTAVVSLMLSAHALFRDDRQRRVAVMLLALLWIIPYQAVRTSSESLGGDFLTLGVAALVLGSSGSWQQRRFPLSALTLAGLCFGLSFEFRYQTAFAVAGTVLWVWLAAERARTDPRRWLEIRPFLTITALLAAVLPAIALGTLVDRWGYGQWTVAPWNYFRANILEHKANEFGTDPFYGYLYLIQGNLMAPFTILWTLAAAVCWCRFPRHVVTLTTLPFVLVHSLVAHKEARFMFPILQIATPMFVLAFVPASGESLRPAWLNALWQRRRGRIAKLAYGINLVALISLCFTMWRPGVELQKSIYDHYDANTRMYVVGKKDPYQFAGVNMYFYRPAGFTYIRLEDYEELRFIERGPENILLITDRISLSPEQAAIVPDARLTFRAYPSWMEKFNYFDWLSRARTFSMYAIERPKRARHAIALSSAHKATIR